jgi:hypothetical protein
MAESGELPQEIRVENMARAAVQQERLLRKRQQREAAVAKAQQKARDAALARLVERSVADARVRTAAQRLRRSRAMTTVLLVASLVAGGVGVQLLLASGAWLLLLSSAVVAIGSLLMLSQMAAVARARARASRPVAASRVELVEPSPTMSARRAREPWTPVPVPKPLYLSRPQVARATDSELQAAAELRQAAADAERKLREAREAPEVRPLRPASRFASMGIVDPSATRPPDIDAALARRRA